MFKALYLTKADQFRAELRDLDDAELEAEYAGSRHNSCHRLFDDQLQGWAGADQPVTGRSEVADGSGYRLCRYGEAGTLRHTFVRAIRLC